jgi:hypothetical protein
VADTVKSVTITIPGAVFGVEKLFPLLDTCMEIVFVPIGHDTGARSAAPAAAPDPQLPLHWTATRGQPFGSLPEAVRYREAPAELVALTT